MTPEDRVVAVLGARQGSGVLLTPELILTSGHVVSPGTPTEAIALGNWVPTTCTVVWLGAAEQCDAALLHAHRPLVDADALPKLRWGVLSTREPVPGCQALGFPDVERSALGDLDVAQVPGTLIPGAARVRGRSVLRTDHHPPAPRRPDESPWSGLSGGPVYAGPLLVGVVAEDREGWQHSAIEAVPLFQILGKAGFTAALRKYWPARPEAIPLHYPRVDDFAYEARYVKAVKARYSRLEVFGLDDLGEHERRWDLDTAYLSLQAEAAPDREGAWVPQEPRRVEDLLALHPRAILRGEAGAGKTTLVWWLASHAACQTLPKKLAALNGLVPFVVPMRRLAALGITSPSPAQLPAIAIQEDGMPDGWAGRMLDSGRVLLLVDGLDELPRDDRAPARQWLDEFLRRYPQTRCLTTVRPRAVEDGWLEWQGFEELQLLPMSDADIQEFVTAWHNAARLGKHGEERTRLDHLERNLALEFQRNKVLSDLARTPLLCAVICALHRRRSGLLPHTRWALYRSALAMLLGNRDVRRGIGTPEGIELEAEDAQQLLQHIAIWLVRNRQTELTRKQGVRQIELAMRSLRQLRAYTADALMDHLLNRSGLLQERSPDSIQFIHRTFQDFLAAKEFQDSDCLKELLDHAAEEQWQDVIRLVIGHCNRRETQAVISGLVAAGDVAGEREARFALRTLSVECAMSAGALDDSLHDEVWERLRTMGVPRTDVEAIHLASLGPDALAVIPEPEGLRPAKAVGYVQVLRQLGDAGLSHLARYGRLDAREVRAEIVASWPYLDTPQFAEQVLAGMRLDDMGIRVTRHAQLVQLSRLGHIRRLLISGHYDAESLRTALRGCIMRELLLSGNDSLADIGLLRDHPEIEDLSIRYCPMLKDLSALAELNLTTLHLGNHRSRSTALTVLPSLADLRTLRLDQLPDRDGRFPNLPPNLEHLTVVSPNTLWLHSLATLPNLKSLFLYAELARPHALRHLRRQPHLTELGLWEKALSDPDERGWLPGIRLLTLVVNKPPALAPDLRRRFPGLRKVHIIDERRDVEQALDLSALVGGPDLEIEVDNLRGRPLVVPNPHLFGDRLTINGQPAA
ncbi:NACHT domain-containing protein [Streptomyces huiliensis]|uniref:NACHT domain-containing protein n=1 Tax=Streptomyces huiliensis TaxID=2876027 RepID=UPI001CC1924E|nr:NACHT domain-containing protein [Streptomyces huiliensis]MBZ4318295.1 NACHT domain-containing protein [Streptomyces huiliensis]